MNGNRNSFPLPTWKAGTAIVYSFAGLIAATAQTGSFDLVAGNRLMGWADDGVRPARKPTVGAFINRPPTNVPDFAVVADISRTDLAAAGIPGFGFELFVPAPFRTGASFEVCVAVQTGEGGWHALSGSPRMVSMAPLRPPPQPLPVGSRPPVSRKVQLWYGAENTWAIDRDECFSAFAKTDQWRGVLRSAEALDLHNNVIGKATREQLTQLKRVLTSYRLKLVAEVGGLNPWLENAGDQFGEASAAEEMSWSKLWLTPEKEGGLGGRYDVLLLDDPLWRGLYPQDKQEGRSIDYVANELADAIQVWRKRFPKLQIVLSCNFPNWGWKGEPAYFNFPNLHGAMGRGDYFPIVQRALQVLERRGTKPYALFIDNPYDFVEQLSESNQRERLGKIDLMARMLDFEKTTREFGLKFGFYLNTNAGDLEGPLYSWEERDQIYWTHVSNYIEAYRAAGGRADIWSTYSWMKTPTRMIPETTPHTQSWNFLQLRKRLRGQ
jgi:hypothetical protein